MDRKGQPIIRPSLVAPRDSKDQSIVKPYSNQENSRMVRGEMLYKTSDPRNPANGR